MNNLDSYVKLVLSNLKHKNDINIISSHIKKIGHQYYLKFMHHKKHFEIEINQNIPHEEFEEKIKALIDEDKTGHPGPGVDND